MTTSGAAKDYLGEDYEPPVQENPVRRALRGFTLAGRGVLFRVFCWAVEIAVLVLIVWFIKLIWEALP